MINKIDILKEDLGISTPEKTLEQLLEIFFLMTQ